MSKIDGRVSFEDDGESKFIQFSVLALEEIEEHYDCSIEVLPDILSGRRIRNKLGQLVPAPPRHEMIGDEYVLDDDGKKIELPPEPPRLKEVVTLFRAGLLEYDENISRADAARIITSVGVQKIGGMIEEAILRAFPDANPDAVAALEAGSGKKPKAARRR